MTEKTSAYDLFVKLATQAGISKKMAAEILRALPAIIETGLEKDGEARVKGLGTFRLKKVRSKTGRNPKTGERVIIPAHNKITFMPESSFREFLNRDNRMLGYQVLDKPEEEGTAEEITETPTRIEDLLPPETLAEPTVTEPLPSKLDIEAGNVPAEEPTREPEGFTPTLMPSGRQTETLKDGTEPPPRKRIHWLIPLTLGVIILLSLVFYLRNCRDGGRLGVVDSQQPAVTSEQSTVDSEQSAVDSEQSAVDSEQSAVDSEQSAVGGEQLEVSGRQSALTVTSGRHLFQLSRDVYDGNPYLWVLIYKANKETISDPAQVITGRELIIPALEGSPADLSRADSVEVSAGYAMVYEYYRDKDPSQAEDYRKAMERYSPN